MEYYTLRVGKVLTIVDESIYTRLAGIKLNLHGGYAYIEGLGLLHRIVIQAPDNMVVHHINHNKLDNRLCNLKLMCPSEHLKLHNYEDNLKPYIVKCYIPNDTELRQLAFRLNGNKNIQSVI